MKHSRVADLLPDDLLGALPRWQRLRIAFHLRRCAACREDLARTAEALALLGQAVEQHTPPPELAGRVLAQLPASNPLATRAIPLPGARAKVRLSGTIATAALASAVLLISLVSGALAGWGIYLNLQLDDLSQQVQELNGELQSQRKLLYEAANPNMERVPLESNVIGIRAGGVLMVDRDGYVGVLAVLGLDPPPPGGVYRVWLVHRNGTRWNAGLLLVDESGWGVVDIRTEVPVKEFRAVGVSVEPMEGSAGGTKVLGGEIQVK